MEALDLATVTRLYDAYTRERARLLAWLAAAQHGKDGPMPARFCMDCGQLYNKDTAPGLRCPACQRAHDRQREQHRPSAAARGYGHQHAKRAKAVVDHAIANNIGCCYCGGPAGQPGPHATSGKPDPFVGCHVQPQSRGGSASGTLAAGHRSCNNAAAGQLNRGKKR